MRPVGELNDVFEALIVTLREGVEVALILGIILVFVRRSGGEALVRWVFWGLGAAVGASLAGAAVLHRAPFNQEAAEGTLMLLAAAFVVTTVVWMWRTARHLKGHIEGHLRRISDRDETRVGWGLFTLTFLLVSREGVETVLLLAAVRLTTEGIFAGLGALIGLALAVLFGIAVVHGSVRIDLGRFFKVTGVLLLILAAHLLAGSLHEFAEAGVVPIGRRTMRVLGPIVKSQGLILVSVLALPLLLLLIPGRRPAVDAAPGAGPAWRLEQARLRRERGWRILGAGAGLVVLALLTASMASSQFPKTFDPPRMVRPDGNGMIRLPSSELEDGNLHRFGVQLDGVTVRFLLMRSGGTLRAAMDACQVCGAYGYVKRGSQVVCLACAADINPATIGAEGGCNPLPLPMRLDGEHALIRAADLLGHRELFAEAAAEPSAPPER